MESYLNSLVRYRRSVQQQDADSWYDDSSEANFPETEDFDYPDVDYSGKGFSCLFWWRYTKTASNLGGIESMILMESVSLKLSKIIKSYP